MPEYAIPLMIAGTGLSAYQQYQIGKEEREAYGQRAAVAEEEAKVTEKASLEEARKKTREGKKFVAMQKAAMARAGVKIAGTGLLVMEETKKEFARDVSFITEGGMAGAKRWRSQAGFERRGGKGAYRAGIWGAGTTLLTGAGNILWRKYRLGD